MSESEEDNLTENSVVIPRKVQPRRFWFSFKPDDISFGMVINNVLRVVRLWMIGETATRTADEVWDIVVIGMESIMVRRVTLVPKIILRVLGVQFTLNTGDPIHKHEVVRIDHGTGYVDGAADSVEAAFIYRDFKHVA